MTGIQVPLLLGNDVVDLTLPESRDKHLDMRFVARVFAESERLLIEAATDPTIALWTLWTAKESAYKIAKKIAPDLIFAHRQFIVRPVGDSLAVVRHATDVRFFDTDILVRWRRDADWLHAVAFFGERSAEKFETAVEKLPDFSSLGSTDDFTRSERESIHSTPSFSVRALAKRMLRERFNIDSPQVIRERRPDGFGAPFAAERGHRLPWLDLSLSHDGTFVAGAIASS